MVMDDLGKAIAVGAEEHRISSLGRVGGMHQQQIVEAGPAYLAAQQCAVLVQHLRGAELVQFVGADQ
ncbi:hypothetical protein D3C76_1778270 [compost metagenome]